MPKRTDRPAAKGARRKAPKSRDATGDTDISETEADRIVSAFLDNREMEETRSYLARGRRFEALDTERLNQDWVALFRALVAGDNSRLQDLDDVGAEIRLRGLAPPEHLVQAELATVAEMAKREGPVLSESARRELRDFLGEVAKPKTKN
ncbi:MAG TPA: hypothetical protein VJ890_13515 [Vineibacter sp.]|nr:hypothetical protein [Vineibacter sp.]